MPTESNKSSQAAKGTRKIAPAEARSAFGPLGVDEGLHGLEPGIEAGGDEILALAGEEPELLALPPRRELAKELQARIGGGGDHPGLLHRIAGPALGEARLQASSAAFAWAAIAENAAGSLTAMSARTLRSSSMFALRQPATNWLYDSPSRRAAALMRTIQSRRKTRLRALRSRYAWTSAF